MSTIAYVQEQEFTDTINSGTLAVVDFTASWCGPCRIVGVHMEQLAAEYPNATVVKLDIEQDKETAQKFSVRRIPAVLIFKNGEILENIVGVKPYETFSAAVTKHLAS